MSCDHDYLPVRYKMCTNGTRHLVRWCSTCGRVGEWVPYWKAGVVVRDGDLVVAATGETVPELESAPDAQLGLML